MSESEIEVELPGKGSALLDVGAELLFKREFEAEFGRLMIEWWASDPAALAEAFPAYA
jgi:hypothetical protein